ncbi:metalloprotease PmbA [Thauera linaloolentis]|uniref:Peptidase U62 modulator of DNA gyrase n=1 Tax=Thauera linaloolentis (strain DSM 12138 / JCM 21573 / CCUG 41526 / CIP 105981 / IAM 15112 / NBRC 102519 / 47Lol) TaxID=1123367 RepID=N6YZE1_THAL4|nr:metalloprotease PmbA [Thauera linaloolentis]ENO85289.1 peptidase U62 modulator of DNA gyrase [Thauera linaloolentis 47Lol = DSM 12138]MCM8563988.1 metalloprotease PmbA [Thauera linaloolentis]
MSDQGFSFSQAHLREIATDIVKYAQKRGASACETDVSEGFGQSVGVRKAEVETIEYNRDKGVGVTVYIGQQRGYASTSDFSKKALKATVDAALSIARFTAPDPCAGLADAELMAREKDMPGLDLFHPWAIGIDEAIALARRCEDAAFAVSPKISNSEGANTSIQQSHFVSTNSHGFIGGYATTRHGLSCSVIAGEGDAMQREYWYDSRRDPAELTSAEDIGRLAGERALARLGGKQVRTCEVPVLFEAPLAVALIGNFVQAVSGGALYRKASFLLDSLGQQVFSPVVSIAERPHLKKAFGSSPFDSDGVATRDREIVTGGVLNGYFLSAYSARKLGMQTTGNAGGSHNLIVTPGEQDLAGLIRQMDRGLLVTELLGHGVNYVTGDYSRGAAGFWVEKGKIKHAVEEVTIAGNLRDMFRSIVAIGNDALPRGAKHCGSILIERMKVAGR